MNIMSLTNTVLARLKEETLNFGQDMKNLARFPFDSAFRTRILDRWANIYKANKYSQQFNDQLRWNFREGLRHSSSNGAAGFDEARKKYLGLSERYLDMPLFKATRWLNRYPATVPLLITAKLAAGFLTPLPWFVLGVPFFSYIYANVRQSFMLRKLDKMETSLQRFGFNKPEYFLAKDENLTYKGLNIQENEGRIIAMTPDEQDIQIMDERFGEISVAPVFNISADPKIPNEIMSFIISRFDPEKRAFAREYHIPAIAYIALKQHYKADIGGGTDFQDMAKIENKYRLPQSRHFLYLASVIFPQNTLEQNEALMKEAEKQTSTRLIQNAFLGFGQGLCAGPLAGKITLDDITTFARTHPFHNRHKARAMAALMANENFGNPPFLKTAEIIENMSPAAIAKTGLQQPLPYPTQASFLMNGKKWGDVAAYYLAQNELKKRFTTDQITESCRNFDTWGEALMVMALMEQHKNTPYEALQQDAIRSYESSIHQNAGNIKPAKKEPSAMEVLTRRFKIFSPPVRTNPSAPSQITAKADMEQRYAMA